MVILYTRNHSIFYLTLLTHQSITACFEESVTTLYFTSRNNSNNGYWERLLEDVSFHLPSSNEPHYGIA